jgi:hypothetical protein
LGNGTLLTLESNFAAEAITVTPAVGTMIYSTEPRGSLGELGAMTTRAFLE